MHSYTALTPIQCDTYLVSYSTTAKIFWGKITTPPPTKKPINVEKDLQVKIWSSTWVQKHRLHSESGERAKAKKKGKKTNKQKVFTRLYNSLSYQLLVLRRESIRTSPHLLLKSTWSLPSACWQHANFHQELKQTRVFQAQLLSWCSRKEKPIHWTSLLTTVFLLLLCQRVNCVEHHLYLSLHRLDNPDLLNSGVYFSLWSPQDC